MINQEARRNIYSEKLSLTSGINSILIMLPFFKELFVHLKDFNQQ